MMHSTKTICSDKNRLRAAINNLVSFSLVQRKTTSSSKDGSFWIHPLVHLWAQEIKSDETPASQDTAPGQKHFKRAICIAGDRLQPRAMHRTQMDWDFDRSIATHIELFAKYLPEICNQKVHDPNETDPQFAEALYKIGSVECHWERYDRSESFLRASISAYEKTSDAVDHFIAMGSMSITLGHQAGRTAEALVFARRALERIQSLGEKERVGAEKRDIYRFTFMCTVARLLSKSGKYDEATELYNSAISEAEETVGPEHILTLAILDDMATDAGNNGHNDQAMELYMRALHGYRCCLAAGHILINRTNYNLGICYNRKGNYQEALRYAFLALESYEKTHGMHNTATLDAVSQVGNTYYNSGDYENALTYYRRSLEGYEKTVGTDHTDTLITMQRIGVAYYNSHDYKNALTYYRRLLEGRKKTLGADHADTLEAAQDIRDAERYITTTESSAASQTSSI